MFLFLYQSVMNSLEANLGKAMGKAEKDRQKFGKRGEK